MADIQIARGDRLPAATGTLSWPTSDGLLPLDLNNTLIKKVQFCWRRTGEAIVTMRDAEIVDPQNRKVRYAWATGDTDIAGAFTAWWLLTFVIGSVTLQMRVPNKEPYLSMVIDP